MLDDDLRLREGGLEGGAGAHTSASSRRSTVEGTIVGAGLRAVLAVDQDVVEGADRAGGAHEDARVHVRGARGTLDAHRVAVHVDLTGDIHNTEVAKGVLSPSVGSLAVDQLSVGIDGGPGARGTIGEADPHRLAGGNGGGDDGLNGVDPRAGDAPDDENEVLARTVGEFVLVRATLTKPSLTIGGGRVDTHAGHAQGRELGGISVSQGSGTLPVSRNMLVCVRHKCLREEQVLLDVVGAAVDGRVNMAHRGSTCLANCEGGQHQGLHCVAHL